MKTGTRINLSVEVSGHGAIASADNLNIVAVGSSVPDALWRFAFLWEAYVREFGNPLKQAGRHSPIGFSAAVFAFLKEVAEESGLTVNQVNDQLEELRQSAEGSES